jgi:hypothetical protein
MSCSLFAEGASIANSTAAPASDLASSTRHLQFCSVAKITCLHSWASVARLLH